MDTDPLTDPAAPDQVSETGPGQPAAEGDHAGESDAAPAQQPQAGAATIPDKTSVGDDDWGWTAPDGEADLPDDEAALLVDGSQPNPYAGADEVVQEDYS